MVENSISYLFRVCNLTVTLFSYFLWGIVVQMCDKFVFLFPIYYPFSISCWQSWFHYASPKACYFLLVCSSLLHTLCGRVRELKRPVTVSHETCDLINKHVFSSFGCFIKGHIQIETHYEFSPGSLHGTWTIHEFCWV